MTQQRQCSECGSELMLTLRPDNQLEPGMVPTSPTYWRCSICGGGFTAEQIRKGKRAKSVSSELHIASPRTTGRDSETRDKGGTRDVSKQNADN